MKAKIFSIALLMCLSVTLMAQTQKNDSKKQQHRQDRTLLMQGRHRGPADGLNLTDAQKEAFKQSRLNVQKQIQPIRNELGEAEAHQKSLMSAEKPDLGAINKNIEKIGAMRIEMAKIQAKHHLEMRAQLTDEQQLKFDMMKGKMGREKGFKGMRNGRGI